MTADPCEWKAEVLITTVPTMLPLHDTTDHLFMVLTNLLIDSSVKSHSITNSQTFVSLADTKLWDILCEIVKLCMYPSPLNPFAVDLKYFDGLPLAERVIATGAMASFLQKVVCSGEHNYNARGESIQQFQ